MVEAYLIGMQRLKPGEMYLIGSEDDASVHTFREALETLISMSSVDGITHRTHPDYVRPTQVPRLIGDTSKFRLATGWEPKIPYERILSDTLEYWRQRVAEGRH